MPYKPRICKICQKEFAPVNSVQKYCSACKSSVCIHCGKPFKHRGPTCRGTQYCSQECYLAHRWGKSHLEMVICKTCGNVFSASLAENRKYCSIECAAKSRAGKPSLKRNGTYIKCDWCGTVIYRRPCEIKRSKRHFCSRSCSAKWWAEFGLHGKDHPRWRGGYSEKAYSNGWRAARRAVIERSDGKCEVCGLVPERYEVHHIKPVVLCETPEEANNLKNLMGVCRSCHRQEELKSKRRFGLV